MVQRENGPSLVPDKIGFPPEDKRERWLPRAFVEFSLWESSQLEVLKKLVALAAFECTGHSQFWPAMNEFGRILEAPSPRLVQLDL
jgi:hypothetical protein